MDALHSVSTLCFDVLHGFRSSFNWKVGASIAATSLVGACVVVVFRLRKRLNPIACSWSLQKNGINLTGKLVVITGANTGIGKEVARKLASWNADVVLACRSQERGDQAVQDINITNASISCRQLDLSSLQSVKDFVDFVAQGKRKVDILINNAALFGCPFLLTEDGFETQFQVNYLGHFLLTNLLMEKKLLTETARIVCVSSGLYKKGTIDFDNLNSEIKYREFAAYCDSKLAIIHYVRELAKRLPVGITANAVHPGVVLTELARYRANTIPRKILLAVVGFLLLRTPQQGAVPVIGVATDPCLENISGHYFGDSSTPEELAPVAEDAIVAKKLWQASEVMVKHDFPARFEI